MTTDPRPEPPPDRFNMELLNETIDAIGTGSDHFVVHPTPQPGVAVGAEQHPYWYSTVGDLQHWQREAREFAAGRRRAYFDTPATDTLNGWSWVLDDDRYRQAMRVDLQRVLAEARAAEASDVATHRRPHPHRDVYLIARRWVLTGLLIVGFIAAVTLIMSFFG